ncbi:hypothetical protein V8D89_014383 [Ganoderma adspersum]
MVLTIAELNPSILREICSCMTAVKDVLSFSRTCSAFRPIAVARRLGMPIDLRREKILRNIYSFVSVDRGQRGPHIRELSIPFNIPREGLSEKLNLAEPFLALLSCATSLRKLSLYVPILPSPLFTAHLSVLPAVAGLTSLQELELTASTEVAIGLLGSTCSALKVFRYQCPYEYKGSESPGSLSISMAPQLVSMLEEIQVPSDFVPIAARSHATFPAVRSVTLTDGTRGHEVFRWHVDELLALFPNLDRTFIVEAEVPEAADGVVSAGPNDHLVVLRAKNHVTQNARAWKGLNRVSILSDDGLYALGLACPIRHLSLSLGFIGLEERPELEAQATSRIRAILEDCTPSHLDLSHILYLSRTSLSPDWDALLAKNVAAKLTHLVLSVSYHHASDLPVRGGGSRRGEQEIERPWPVILDSLVSGLRSLHRLTHIRIDISAHLSYVERPCFLVVVYDGLSSFKFDRVLDVLPRSIPSLSCIAVTSRGSVTQAPTRANGFQGGNEEWNVSRAWRVQRNTAADSRARHGLEQLSAAEAEAVNDTEELHDTAESHNWGYATDWGSEESYSGGEDSEEGDSEEGDSGDDSDGLFPEDESTSDEEALA